MLLMSEHTLSEIEHAKLNGETARVNWHELQRFFAQGVVLHVAERLDLIDVATQMSLDNVTAIKGWFDAGELTHVSDPLAARWFAANTELWTVVVKPYILVQETSTPQPTTH